MFRQIALLVTALSIGMAPAALAQIGAGFKPYLDSTYGYSAQLPLDDFAVVDPQGTPGIALREIGGQATINLYGGPAAGMTRDALEQRLEAGAGTSTTTYRAGGNSWFVLSGYYDRAQPQDTTFYTKVLFSADQQTFSAFEITFPAGDKPRFAPLVEHFEDTFTRPRP